MKRQGFTLFEVLISVAIFLLIAGAVFAAVSAGVRTTTELAQHRLKAERLDTLLSFLRTAFTNLPPTTEFSLRKRRIGSTGSTTELLLRRAPGTFPLLDERSSLSGSILALRPAKDGSLILAVTGYPERLSEEERDHLIDEDSHWTRLLSDVRQIRWRFLPRESTDLVETWEYGKGRPRLVEMMLWLEGEEPIQAQFWIPEISSAKAGGAKR